MRISGISFKYLLKGVRPLRFIILFTFILNLFFVQGETPLIDIGFIHITREALRNAIFFALRLIFLVMGTSVLTLTTSPVQLTDGLERLLRPLQRFHFPAHELAMMMTIALRFIPTLLEETDTIKKAQIARGARFESRKLHERAAALLPLVVPIFLSAFQRADELATAMEARGYRGAKYRVRKKEKPMRFGSWAALLVCTALCALVIIF